MFTIAKRFHFSASHQLTGLPEGHKCARLHGHNYEVEIIIKAKELNLDGFVLDYGDLAPFKEFLDRYLDHRHLNDVLVPASPTAEHLAVFLWRTAKEQWPTFAIAVKVWETPDTWAMYEGKE